MATIMLVACGRCENCKSGNPTSLSDPIKYYRVSKLFDYEGCSVYQYNYHGHWETYHNCETK